MTTLTWLEKLQNKAVSYIQNQPTKVQYGLNMFAFWPQEIAAQSFQAQHYAWHGPAEINFTSLENALENSLETPLIKNHFSLTARSSRVTALTIQKSADGVLINIPEHYQESTPCTLTISGATHDTSLGHVIIKAGAHSKLTLITKLIGQQISSTNISVIIETGAQLNHIIVQEESSLPQFLDIQYTVAEKAILNSIDIASGNIQAQKKLSIQLQGYAAHGNLYHLNALKKNAHYDIDSSIFHQAANTFSQLYTRAVLEDSSHMIYRGLITVEDPAKESESVQKEATLILSPEAKIDAVPMLDIRNDLVQCSHSASMTNLDPEQLFYMATRGLTPAETRRMLIESFIHQDLNAIVDTELRVWLQDNINQLVEL